MKETVTDDRLQVVDAAEVDEAVTSGLPDEVQVVLADIAGVAREGLLALSVTTGLAVLSEMMEAERAEVCGPIHAKDPERAFERGGTTPTSVVLGGRKIPICRPRVQATDGSGEMPLETFCVASDTDLLTQVAMERMLVGVSTRKYARANEQIGESVAEAATSESKSSVSRRFVTGTKKALAELLARDLGEVDAAVLMVDGVDFAGECCVVAMVITHDGTKVPVGLRHGDTENATVVKDLLADLVERGLDYTGGLLVIIDGAKALASAVRKVFGAHALVGRCQLHKRRNIADYLPKDTQPSVDRRLVAAFNHPDPDLGLQAARCLAAELDKTYPDAAASLREGLEDMFCVRRLGIDGALLKTLMSTNPIESMISTARTTTRNVKRWRDGEMRLRWCAAGMLEAEKSFRRVKGHRQMPVLVAALRRHAEHVTGTCNTEKDSIAA